MSPEDIKDAEQMLIYQIEEAICHDSPELLNKLELSEQ